MRKISKHWMTLIVSVFILALGILASCSRQLATVPTVAFTPTFSPTVTNSRTPTKTNTPAGPTNTFTNTPTATFSNTPCGFPGNTCTFTQTFTSTNTPTGPTATPTGTPASAILYEDFNSNTGAYASGDPWVGASVPTYMYNGYGETGCTLSAVEDTVIFHNAADAIQMTINWTAASGTAAWGFYSGHLGDYGAAGSVAATPPSAESFWVYPSVSITFNSFIDCNGVISNYTNTAGGNPAAPITVPAATWTNIVLPLSTCPTCWSVDPTTMDFTKVQQAAGMLVAGPASVPVTWTVDLDDIYFYP